MKHFAVIACLAFPFLSFADGRNLLWTGAAGDLHTKALPRVEERARPAGAPVKLVENGELRFVVVVKNVRETNYRGPVHDGWEILKEAFSRATGKTPTLVEAERDRAKWQAAPCVILLGDSAATRECGFNPDELEDQELYISTFEKVGVAIRGIAILGNETIKVGMPPPEGMADARRKPDTVAYAATDFCERLLGCRYYYPGEDGFYFPTIANLTVEPIAYSSAPYFNTRGNAYNFNGPMRTKEQRAAWAKLMGPLIARPEMFTRWRLGRTLQQVGMHTPDPCDIANAYPDRIDRLFYRSPNGHLWYSKESYFANYYDVFHLDKGGFADTLMEIWKKFYATKGKDHSCRSALYCGQEWACFGMTDVYMNPEDCLADPIVQREKLVTEEDFRRAREVDGRTILANVYGRFYKYLCDRLAKELPDQKLYVLSYYNCKYAPTRYSLPANFDCIVCDGSLLSYVMDPPARAKSKALFKGWYDAMGGRAPSMAWLYGAGDPFANCITPEYLGEVVKLLGPYLGRRGIFFNYGMDWHGFYGFYACAHQQWDPDFDAVAAFDEMADKMFGKAAPAMKRFHNRLRANVEKYVMPTLFKPEIVYPLSEVDALENLLREAEAAVKDDPLAARRVRFVATPWPTAFKAQREKLTKRSAGGAGVYSVARRTGENVDWSKIPSVPGSNGLKFVWDESGLYGRAEGDVHYTLTTDFDHPGQNVLKLDYDTMVPSFNLSFTKTFDAKVYKMIALKPFGRLRLLGAGDDPNVAETSPAQSPLGHFQKPVTAVADTTGLRLTFTAPKATYTHQFHYFHETGRDDRNLRSMQTGTEGAVSAGFFNWAGWLDLTVNGIPLVDVDLGAANLKNYAEGDRRGFEYALNFDGARLNLRLYMTPDSPVLWGEMEEEKVRGEGRVFRPITNATFRTAAIPSQLVRDKKKEKLPYRRQLRTATRTLEHLATDPNRQKRFELKADDVFFLAQDANYDGTADDRGIGPCCMFVDMTKVEKGTALLGKDNRDIVLDFKLKPGFGTLRFGIWEDRQHRHANDEIFSRIKKNTVGACLWRDPPKKGDVEGRKDSEGTRLTVRGNNGYNTGS